VICIETAVDRHEAGSLGRGAAIALMLVPLLFPALFLMLRNLKRRDW